MRTFIISLTLTVAACNNPSKQENPISNDANSESQNTARKQVVTPRASPAANLKQTIGLSSVTIAYSRPSVISSDAIDRTGRIWGILVPYDFNSKTIVSSGKPTPWRAGANENTTITLSHDAKIEGQPIAAGKYGLHMAIHQDGGATVIFSNKSDAWGSFSYDQADDALRVEVDTEEISHVERLIYAVLDVNKTTGKIVLDWEKKRIEFKIEFDTHGLVMVDFNRYLSDTTGLSWSDYNRAAIYCADNLTNLEQGLSWAESSIAIQESFRTLSTKVLVLDAMNKSNEARAIKSKALDLTSTSADDFYSYGTQLLLKGHPDQAMKIYQRLQDQWPDNWLSAHSMARHYSMVGNYEKAIVFEKEALDKAPDANKGYIEWAISKLEKGINFN